MFRELLAAEFARYVTLSGSQLDQLEEHYKLLLRWNQSLNLTRIVDLQSAVRLHYCESLFVGATLPAGDLTVIDVGSGAGFPGIPLAILRPECRIDLVESHKRKSVFLREAVRGLPNVQVIAERAESVEGDWDWLVSRAVRPDEVLGLPIGRRKAILMGSKDLEGFKNPEAFVKVPWGLDRILAMFHVEQ